MRNKELFSDGEQFPVAQADDFPEEFQPLEPVPADDFPEDFGPLSEAEAVPDPVVRRELTPREWMLDMLSNAPGSIWQNVKDMAMLFRPWGKRASGKGTAIPGALDLVRLAAESQIRRKVSWNPMAIKEGAWNPLSWLWSEGARGYVNLDENVFGGAEQSGRETPMMDAFVDYFMGRYDFTKPEVRAAFERVFREDPIGVITDMATVASLGTAYGGGAAGVARAARAGSKTGRAMNIAIRTGEIADKVINRGFNVPGVPGRLIRNVGVADIIDPGVWAVRGVNATARAAGQGLRRVASPFKPKTAEEVLGIQDAQQELVDQGFTDKPMDNLAPEEEDIPVEILFPEDFRLDMTQENIDNINTPLSMINRENEWLVNSEARRFDKGYQPLVDAVNDTARHLEHRMNAIMRRAHEDGDLSRLAEELGKVYEESRKGIMDGLDQWYQLAGAEPGLVVNMRPVYEAIQRLREQDRQAYRLTGKPDSEYVAFQSDAQMRNLNEHVQRLADQNRNELTPEYLEGRPDPEATTPVAREGQPAPHTEAALYGTPVRRTKGRGGTVYQTTYAVVDLANIITSHIVQQGNISTIIDNPAFDSNLQVKDMKLPSQALIVYEMAKDLWPELLDGGNRTTQHGTPILDNRMMAISGNHRLEALRVAMYLFPQKAQAYKDMLPGEMDRFGLTNDISQMEFPVLVRMLDDDVDVYAFAREGNVPGTAQLSETSQATQDTHILDDTLFQMFDAGRGDQSITEVLRLSSNDRFQQGFLDRLTSAEKPQFEGLDNKLSEQGQRRVINALIHKVFDGDFGMALRSIFTRGASEGFKNIRRGILGALPALIRMRNLRGSGADAGIDYGAYNITESMSEAILKLKDFQDKHGTGSGVLKAIDEFLAQSRDTVGDDMFSRMGETRALYTDLDEIGQDILRVLATAVGTPTNLRDFIREYTAIITRSIDEGVVSREGDVGVADDAAGMEADIALEPPEVIINDLADKYVKSFEEGTDAERREGLANLFAYSDEAAAAEEAAAAAMAEAGTKPVEPVKVADVPPDAPHVLFENVIAYRNELVEALHARRGGRRSQNWRTQMLAALDEAIMTTLAESNPDKAALLPTVQNYLRMTQHTLNSAFAKQASDLLNGASNPHDPAVMKAMETIFTPKDTPEAIHNKYQLMGGYNSDVGKRARRVFLSRLMDFTKTEVGKGDAAAFAHGEQPLGDVSMRYNPEGISQYLNQFINSASDYSYETLTTILGIRTVRDLYQLDEILKSFGRFMKRAKKDDLFFGEQVQAKITHRILEHLGWTLASAGFGGLGALAGGLPFFAALALAGFGGAKAAQTFNAYIFDKMYRNPSGRLSRKQLLHGIELSWKDAWRRGSRVIMREEKIGEPAGMVDPQRRSQDPFEDTPPIGDTRQERKAQKQERKEDFINNPDDDTKRSTRGRMPPPSSAAVRTGLKVGRLGSKREDNRD